MFETRTGEGPPLVLVHGLGADSGSWAPVIERLATQREVIAVDLPGHGQSPPLAVNSIATYADALELFLVESDLSDADLVGSSVGARLVLELARRGTGGAVVALDPGGFWEDAGARFIGLSLGVSVKLVRALRRFLPALVGNPVGRTLLLAQLSARPWAVDPAFALAEVRKFADTPVFEEVLHDLSHGPRQRGLPAGAATNPIVIGWGRKDRVTTPSQAPRAIAAFPDATLHWFERSGHFPAWDSPDETVDLILTTTGRASLSE